MNISCVGFYYVKDSSRNAKKENKWIKANFDINAEIDRYILEIKPVLDDDDIYDEDEDDKAQNLRRKLKLCDYKSCEPRGSQKYINYTIHLLALSPKLFTKAKKLFLAFLNEEIRFYWFKNLETILTHKFHNSSSLNLGIGSNQSTSKTSLDKFMIENDVYEGSLLTGHFHATVIENEKSAEISIKGKYVLVVTDVGIELRNEITDKLEKMWEIKNMRRFGENQNEFFMELGKFCDDGQGFLSFKVDRGKQLIKELLQTKDNWYKNKSNRKSILKQSEEQEAQTTSNDTKRPSVDETSKSSLLFYHNKLYGVEEIGDKNKKRSTSFEPPKVSPPPIPSDNPFGSLHSHD